MDTPARLATMFSLLLTSCATSPDPAVESSLAADTECKEGLASCGLGLVQVRGIKDAQDAGSENCGKAYQQCGGSTNPASGITCCEAGLQCQVKDSYFSQCISSTGPPSSDSAAKSEPAATAPASVSHYTAETPPPVHSVSDQKSHAGYACPMMLYDGPGHGAASCFCHKAGNVACRDKPCTCREGCDEEAVSQHRETVTFLNSKQASHCQSKSAMLTIPRPYFRDMGDLMKKCPDGIEELLKIMFVNGANAYTKQTGYVGPVMQCIHKPGHISVPWLHLHTFCPSGRVDGMPDKQVSMCRVMENDDDAAQVAQHFVQWLVTER